MKQRTEAKKVSRVSQRRTPTKKLFLIPHTLVRVFYRVERYVLVNRFSISDRSCT